MKQRYVITHLQVDISAWQQCVLSLWTGGSSRCIPGDLCGSGDYRGRHVNASDSIKGLPSECLESSCDCPAPAQVNSFRLCTLWLHVSPVCTLATRSQCPLTAGGVNVPHFPQFVFMPHLNWPFQNLMFLFHFLVIAGARLPNILLHILSSY